MAKNRLVTYTLSMMIFLIMGPYCFADPSIISVNGTFAHKSSVTISGRFFGIKNRAAPVIWDDSEGRTVDSPAALIREGGWTDSIGTTHVFTEDDSDYYDTQYRLSGFRNHDGPYPDNNTTYIAGGHCNYRKMAPANNYRWNRSGSGTNEYYLVTSAGGNPNPIFRSSSPVIDRVVLVVGRSKESARHGTIGSLADHQWVFGDNDSLGFNTVYLRDDSGDPDTSGIEVHIGHDPNGGTGYNVGVTKQFPSMSNLVYVSFYTRYDQNWELDDYLSPNLKVINFEAYPGDTMWCPNFNYNSHPPSASPMQPVNGRIALNIGGQECPGYESNGSVAGFLFTDTSDEWQKWEMLMDFRDADDLELFYVNNQLMGENRGCDINRIDRYGFSVGGYYCQGNVYAWDGSREVLSHCGINIRDEGLGDNFRYFDNIYIDTTFSRVMLANNSNYERSRIVEPQIPSAWDSESITCTVNLGGLSECNTGYLFVFDSNNNHNPVGYPVAIEGGTDCETASFQQPPQSPSPQPPQPPHNLRIVN